MLRCMRLQLPACGRSATLQLPRRAVQGGAPAHVLPLPLPLLVTNSFFPPNRGLLRAATGLSLEEADVLLRLNLVRVMRWSACSCLLVLVRVLCVLRYLSRRSVWHTNAPNRRRRVRVWMSCRRAASCLLCATSCHSQSQLRTLAGDG